MSMNAHEILTHMEGQVRNVIAADKDAMAKGVSQEEYHQLIGSVRFGNKMVQFLENVKKAQHKDRDDG